MTSASAPFDGKTIDRYRLVELLGAGAMGEVYLAVDPRLDRPVALKVLKRGALGDPAQVELLLREARTMAKVSHPNVVQVFDAGVQDEQPWVAMELIRGTTLRQWMGAPHPWAETLQRLIEIGRGIDAAHRAGVVHRDLKPENILVSEDGRVAVTDFGLAVGAVTASASVLRASPVVEANALATPALGASSRAGYMAPEQLRQQGADAKSNQFSFAATAWEAIYGELPYDEAALVAGSAVLPAAPGTSSAPPRVHKILGQALALDPAGRFGSIGQLTDALATVLPRKSTRYGAPIGIAVVLAAVVAVVVVTRPARCDGGAKQLATVWNESRKAAVVSALSAAGPVGTRIAPLVASRLDAYGASWVAMDRDACLATRDHGQSEKVLDERMGCLSQRLQSLDALSFVLTSKGGEVADKAEDSVSQLPDVAACVDSPALGERMPVPAASKAQVDAVTASLAKVSAMNAVGLYKDAVAPAQETVEKAKAAGYPPLLAESLYALARAQLQTKAEAMTTLDQALNAAEVAHEDRLRVEIRLLRSDLLTNISKFDDADKELKAAAAIVERLGDRKLQHELNESLENLASEEGKLDVAAELGKKLIAEAEAMQPPDDRALSLAYGSYAATMLRMTKLEEAAVWYPKAIAIAERLGPKNPVLGRYLGDYAFILGRLRRMDEARPLEQRAQAIIAESVGPESRMMAKNLSNWGAVLVVNREFDEAHQTLGKAIDLARKEQPANEASVATILGNLGAMDGTNGKYELAIKELTESLEIRERLLGKAHPRVLGALYNLASVELLDGQYASALKRCDEAIARGVANPKTRIADDVAAGLEQCRAEALIHTVGQAKAAREALAASHDRAMAASDPKLSARQLMLEARVAWDGFNEAAKAKGLVHDARPLIEKSKDPDEAKAADVLDARIRGGKKEKPVVASATTH